MTKKEESVENRIVAAETLAYLIATSASLQRIAAISNHLIPSMASFLNFDNNSVAAAAAAAAADSASSNSNLYSSNFYFNKYQQQNTAAAAAAYRHSGGPGQQENFAKRMRQAAFRVRKERQPTPEMDLMVINCNKLITSYKSGCRFLPP